MSLRSLPPFIGLLVCVSLWPSVAGNNAYANDISQYFSMSPQPKPVPGFTFRDESGQTLSLKDFRGRFILLNLWATWCASCVSEMPSLEAFQRHFGTSRLNVIALSVDRNGLPAVKSFYQRHGISGLTPYLDPDSLSINALDARFLPTSLLIDAQGREIGRIKGGIDWSTDDVIRFVDGKMQGG